MQSISPVFTEKQQPAEIEIAKDQSEYFTVIGLPVTLQLVDRESGKQTLVSPWGMAFRFRLTEEERAAVAAGKDLLLTQLNFGKPVTPMNVQFCAEGEIPFFGETPATPMEAPAAAEGDGHGLSLVPKPDAVEAVPDATGDPSQP